jgi:hypothetical protein
MISSRIVLVLVLAIVVLMYVKCFMGMKKSGYKLSPEPVDVSPMIDGNAVTKLPYSLECVPGPGKDAAYYTKDLTPGGFCGDQALVRDAMSYKILGGVGGSLLEK